MMPPMRNVSALVPLLALVGLVGATACAPADETAEEPLYWAGVHDLADVGLSVDTLVAAACQTVTG